MFAPWDLGPTVRITAFTLTGVSTSVVAVRFGCRIWVVGKLKLYDYIALASLICTWGLCVINHYQLLYGTGGQVDPKAPPIQWTPELIAWFNKVAIAGAKAWLAYRIMYLVCLALIKFSILVFYLTFATQRTFRNLVHLSIGVVAVFSIVTVTLNGLECPHDPSLTISPKIYDPKYTTRCLNRSTLYFCQAAFNIFSDVVILVLPIPSLLQIRMPTIQRVFLLAVFSVGLIVPIASALRIWALYLWSTSGDQARYFGGYILFWSHVEINTAIICASAPSLQPLFKIIFESIATARTRGAYYYYGDGPNTTAEATGGLTRGSMGSRGDTVLQTPSSSYQRDKISVEGAEDELIIMREIDEEQMVRDRVKKFAITSQLTNEMNLEPPGRCKTEEFL